MSQDLTNLPPETFFRLAVERGGLDLEEVIQGLSPEAAGALRRIAAPAAPPSRDGGLTRSASPPDAFRSASPSDTTPPVGRATLLAPPRCRACGQPRQPLDRFCRNCGRQLRESPPTLTLDDLVAEGRLTPEQAEEAKSTLLSHQSHYPAGARYGVFGGPW